MSISASEFTIFLGAANCWLSQIYSQIYPSFAFSKMARFEASLRLEMVVFARVIYQGLMRYAGQKNRRVGGERFAKELLEEAKLRPLIASSPVHFTRTPEFKAATKAEDREFFSRLPRLDLPLFDNIDFTILVFWGPGVTFRGVLSQPLMSMCDADAAEFLTNTLSRQGNPITQEMYKKRRQRLSRFFRCPQTGQFLSIWRYPRNHYKT